MKGRGGLPLAPTRQPAAPPPPRPDPRPGAGSSPAPARCSAVPPSLPPPAPRRPTATFEGSGRLRSVQGTHLHPTPPGFTPRRAEHGAGARMPASLAKRIPLRGRSRPPPHCRKNGETEARGGFSTGGTHSPTEPTVPPRSSPEATEVLATPTGVAHVGMWAG